MNKNLKSENNGFIRYCIILTAVFFINFGSVSAQLITPLKGGERMLWIGNSFQGFFGPVYACVDSIYSVADPTFKLPHMSNAGKGCGTIMEYVIWGTIKGGTGAIDSINHGNWNYCVFQTWEDGNTWDVVADPFMGCGVSPDSASKEPVGFNTHPNNEDTLLKYLTIIDSTAKSKGARTMIYRPHIGLTEWYGVDSANFAQTFAYVMPRMHNIFYSPVVNAWDSVRHLYKVSNYSFPPPVRDSNAFNPSMYSDGGHQNGNGMALDAFTWYTILSGGLSAVGLNPHMPYPMENPQLKDTLAGVGCIIGRRILQLNGFGNDFEAPTTPSGFAASNITSSSFTLKWTPSTDNVGVTGYEVYLNGVSIGITPVDSIQVSSLGPGVPYSMSVRAYDAAGHYTPYSQPYIVTTAGVSLIANGSFETPVVPVGVGGNLDDPKGGIWTFVGIQCGIDTNWHYDGKQSAYIYNVNANPAYISQAITLDSGSFQCNFYVIGPAWQASPQYLKLIVDTTVLNATFPSDGKWHEVSVPFSIATAGSHTLNLPLTYQVQARRIM